jgi:hypothetical protein
MRPGRERLELDHVAPGSDRARHLEKGGADVAPRLVDDEHDSVAGNDRQRAGQDSHRGAGQIVVHRRDGKLAEGRRAALRDPRAAA